MSADKPKKPLLDLLKEVLGDRKPLIVAREMDSILAQLTTLEVGSPDLVELKARVSGALDLSGPLNDPLVAWVVDDGGDYNDLVVAQTREQAVVLARWAGWNDWGDPDALQARRAERYDEAIKDLELGVVTDLGLLRDLGWQNEDGGSCGECGRNDFDQDIEAWQVCDECDQCGECGHLDDCPNKPRVSG